MSQKLGSSGSCVVLMRSGLRSSHTMKFLALLFFIAVGCSAEPPPSRAYLPPPEVSQSGGFAAYPGAAIGGGGGGGGAQSAVIARYHGNEYTHRAVGSDFHGPAAQFSSAYSGSAAPSQQVSPGYHNAAGYSAGFGRNNLDSVYNNEPANYNFDYSVMERGLGGAEFGHQESRQRESAAGQYHVVLPDGRKQVVSYEADERGFNPQISYEDTSSHNLRATSFDRGYQNPGSRSTGY